MVAESKPESLRGLITGNFDPTLKKYKSEVVLRLRQINSRFVWTVYRVSKHLASPTLAKYTAIAGYFRQYFKDKQACAIAVEDAEAFTDWLVTQIEPITARDDCLWSRLVGSGESIKT